MKALEPTPSPLRLLMQRAATDPLAKQALKQKLIAGIPPKEFSTITTEFRTLGLHHNASLMRHLFASCLENKDQLEEFFKLLNDSTLASEPKFFATIERACLNKRFLPTLQEALSESPLIENEAFMKSLLALSDKHPQIKTVLEQCFKESALSSLEVDPIVKIKSKKTLGSGMFGKVEHITMAATQTTLSKIEGSNPEYLTCKKVRHLARKTFFTCEQKKHKKLSLDMRTLNRDSNYNTNELHQLQLPEGSHFVKLQAATVVDRETGKQRTIDLSRGNRIEKTESLVTLDQEFFEGDTLESFLQGDECKCYDTAIPLAGKILEAIITMHQKNIVHKDLKNDNILVNYKNGHLNIKIIDFGCSSMAHLKLSDKKIELNKFLFGTLDNILENVTGEYDIEVIREAFTTTYEQSFGDEDKGA